jgi:hypothetical protein
MRIRGWLVIFGVVAALVLSTGCIKRDAILETRPIAGNLAAYWTCAVAFASDGRGENANEAFTFVPYFESKVRERGVFEPLGRDEGAEAELTIRLEATGSDERVVLRAEVFDTKSRESLGELKALGTIDPNADAGADAPEPKRFVALRNAADQIVEYLKEKRRTSQTAARHAPAPPPVEDLPPVAGSAVCSTQCHPPAAAVSFHEEQARVSTNITPTMRALRDCLDRVGGQLIEPAVLLRFSPDGQLRHMRVDVGGYEQLECIQNVRAKVPRVSTTRAIMLRCEYRCSVS